MGSNQTPYVDRLNRTGIPFQIAVEASVLRLARKHDLYPVMHEVPAGNRFIDILAFRKDIAFVLECKKVEEESWTFVVTDAEFLNVSRCRLEWFNSRAPDAPLMDVSKVFCSEWNMVEGSPEASFCILPKEKATNSLEQLCQDVLSAGRELFEDAEFGHEFEREVIVPVIVTNARLIVCLVDPNRIDIASGAVRDDNHVKMEDAKIIMFRKTLAARRSNTYVTDAMPAAHWAEDRKRTIFVVRPEALDRFFSGFRSFTYVGVRGVVEPPEFTTPPFVQDISVLGLPRLPEILGE